MAKKNRVMTTVRVSTATREEIEKLRRKLLKTVWVSHVTVGDAVKYAVGRALAEEE